MSSLQGALVELFTPEEKSETEAAMIADGVHLQVLPLEQLGYYGCREKRLPVAVGNCFLGGEDGYDDDFYEDEAYKMAARKAAQLRIRTRCRRIPVGLIDETGVAVVPSERPNFYGYLSPAGQLPLSSR